MTETSFQTPTICVFFVSHYVMHHRLAADEARKLLQPRRDAVAGERRGLAFEPQHQAMPLDLERRARQHAGLRGRHHVGHPQRRAEHAGAIERAGRGQFANARRQLLVVQQADVAEEDRQRDIGAARMVDADEGRMRDDAQRLLAAVVGMRAPADVGHQAGGVAQPLLLGILVDAGRRHEGVGPADQLLAVLRRARAQPVQLLGGGEQRVLLALLGVEQRIQQPLAHAERREHHLARLGLAHDVLQHQRGVGQQRTAGGVHHLDLRQRVRIDPVHQPGEFQRLLGADDVAVHDVQRIAHLRHVQLRQRPPGAADRVEGAAFAAIQAA